jgi:septal ring factor EnvC (AmiA/AmiB activator)
MEIKNYVKFIKHLISQTPLIIDPSRDSSRFQEALAAIPTEKLRSFYQGLTSEERRRFHYTANVCLGYEAWSRLYDELVVQETRARLSDRLEEAIAHKEQELEKTRDSLEEELSRLEKENQTLLRENLKLQAELDKLQQDFQVLKGQQQKLLELVERYKNLLQEVKRFLPPENAHLSAK